MDLGALDVDLDAVGVDLGSPGVDLSAPGSGSWCSGTEFASSWRGSGWSRDWILEILD